MSRSTWIKAIAAMVFGLLVALATWFGVAYPVASALAASSASGDTAGEVADKAADKAGADAAEEDAAEDAAEAGSFQIDLAAEPGEWVTDELADCASCHVHVANSLTDDSCLYAKHAMFDNCFTCHFDNDGLAKAHNHANAKKAERLVRLKKTSVPEELCLSCHNVDDMIAATADEDAFTDGEGTCVNPHDLPDVKDHNEYVTCGTCHSFHQATYTPQESGMASCLGCHHMNVFECNTCHE